MTVYSQSGLIVPGYQADLEGGGGGAVDPDFASVVFGLHMDGANGSTTFTDIKGHAFAGGNSAAISTAQSKFGGASVLLDSTKFVESTASVDQRIVAGPMCIDFWIRLNNVTGFKDLFAYKRDAEAATVFFAANGDAMISSVSALNTGSIFTANTWHYVMINRSGAGSNLAKVFVDGVLKVTGATWGQSDTAATNARWKLGYNTGAFSAALNGYIDDFRFTMGAQRDIIAFTPPIAAFPDS